MEDVVGDDCFGPAFLLGVMPLFFFYFFFFLLICNGFFSVWCFLLLSVVWFPGLQIETYLTSCIPVDPIEMGRWHAFL